MSRIVFIFIFICLAVGTSAMGCAAGARVVHAEPGSNELQLWGAPGTAAMYGREALLSQCPRGYVVDTRGRDLGLGRPDVALDRDPAVAPDASRVVFRCTTPPSQRLGRRRADQRTVDIRDWKPGAVASARVDRGVVR